MKMYEFYNIGRKVGRDEFEVVEKLSSYEKVDAKKSRILKRDVDVLHTGAGSLLMFSLNGNPEHFIKAVVEHKKKEISKIEAELAKKKNDLITISLEYQGYITENVKDGKYYSRGELFFTLGDDGMANGTNIEKKEYDVDTVYTLHSGEEFVSVIADGKATPESGIVHAIYVQGKKTNLCVEGTNFICETPCIVTFEKFKEIVNKTKFEVNFQKE